MDDIIPSPSGFKCEALTVDELAKLLNLHRKTVYDLVKKGQIPGAVYLGRIVRIHGPTVLAWFSSGQAPVTRTRKGRR